MMTTKQDTALSTNRTKCDIYTRVMGYFRPVSHFNIGKKAEHYNRLHFQEQISSNSRFIQRYQNNADSMNPTNESCGLSW